MKSNKEIIKNQHSQVSEIVTALTKVSKQSKLQKIGGYGSVRVGNVYVKLSEDEHRDVVKSEQLGDLYLHIGRDEKGVLYVTNLSFFDDYAHMGMRSGKYVTKDDIISIRLFDDAYQRIVNKIISINKYCNNTENINKEQIAKISTI